MIERLEQGLKLCDSGLPKPKKVEPSFNVDLSNKKQMKKKAKKKVKKDA